MKHIEDAHQEDLINWSRYQKVLLEEGVITTLYDLLYAIPNGGKRNKMEAARFKRQGVKAGVSDLHLPVPVGGFAGLWIEMKRPLIKGKDKPTVQKSQKEWIALMKSLGHQALVAYGKDEAKQAIREYLGDRLLNQVRGEA